MGGLPARSSRNGTPAPPTPKPERDCERCAGTWLGMVRSAVERVAALPMMTNARSATPAYTSSGIYRPAYRGCGRCVSKTAFPIRAGPPPIRTTPADTKPPVALTYRGPATTIPDLPRDQTTNAHRRTPETSGACSSRPPSQRRAGGRPSRCRAGSSPFPTPGTAPPWPGGPDGSCCHSAGAASTEVRHAASPSPYAPTTEGEK